MVGLDRCTGSVLEDMDPHNSIIVDSQDEREELREEMTISEEAFRNLWEHFDAAFRDEEYDSQQKIYDQIIFMVGFALGDYGFDFKSVDTFEEIDHVFQMNKLAPIKASTTIVQIDNGKYMLHGTISRSTCYKEINTINFTPQGYFPFQRDVNIFMYGEVLYDFGNGRTRHGSFHTSSKRIYIMSGVVIQEHEGKTEEEQGAYVDMTLANELGHLQFQEVIIPQYELTDSSIFSYGGAEFSLLQAHELWSDFSSLYYAFQYLRRSGNKEPLNTEMERIIGWSYGIGGYNLTGKFWLDMQNITPTITDGDNYFTIAEVRIRSILKDAR